MRASAYSASQPECLDGPLLGLGTALTLGSTRSPPRHAPDMATIDDETRARRNAARRARYHENLEASRAAERERHRQMREDPEHRARHNAATGRWMSENRERFNAYRKARHATPQGKVEASIRNATKRILGKGGTKPDASLRLLGCTAAEAVAHIEGQFAAGMSWANYGEWEIDHIRPLAGFDLTDPSRRGRRRTTRTSSRSGGLRTGRRAPAAEFAVLIRTLPVISLVRLSSGGG